MCRIGLRGTGTTILLGGAMLWATGAALAGSGRWLGPIQVGPPRTPEEYARQQYQYEQRLNQPDGAPPPPSSWFWPSLREALDQYGWFGRRAGHNGTNDSAGVHFP